MTRLFLYLSTLCSALASTRIILSRAAANSRLFPSKSYGKPGSCQVAGKKLYSACCQDKARIVSYLRNRRYWLGLILLSLTACAQATPTPLSTPTLIPTLVLPTPTPFAL